jgi:Spy/CpxP family protein refolding chaperone
VKEQSGDIMKKLSVILILLALVLGSCAKWPFSQERNFFHGFMDRPHSGARRGGRFGDFEKMCRDLELTEDQKERVEEINKNFMEKHDALYKQIKPLERKLRDELRKNAVDLVRVEKLLNQLSGPDIQRRLLIIEHRIAVEKVFTSEQQDKARRHRPPRNKYGF